VGLYLSGSALQFLHEVLAYFGRSDSRFVPPLIFSPNVERVLPPLRLLDSKSFGLSVCPLVHAPRARLAVLSLSYRLALRT